MWKREREGGSARDGRDAEKLLVKIILTRHQTVFMRLSDSLDVGLVLFLSTHSERRLIYE